MQTANHNNKIEYDPTCYLIAKFSLSDVLVSEGLAEESIAGSFFQTVRELGLPTECFNRIIGTITETATGTQGHSNHCDPDLPVQIRLFYQRKTNVGIPDDGSQKDGGWGYYVIERGINMPISSCREFDRVIELYIYKEGG